MKTLITWSHHKTQRNTKESSREQATGGKKKDRSRAKREQEGKIPGKRVRIDQGQWFYKRHTLI